MGLTGLQTARGRGDLGAPAIERTPWLASLDDPIMVVRKVSSAALSVNASKLSLGNWALHNKNGLRARTRRFRFIVLRVFIQAALAFNTLT